MASVSYDRYLEICTHNNEYPMSEKEFLDYVTEREY